MDRTFRYICACCGGEHEGAPGFAYTAPVYYDSMAEPERARRASLDSDFCIIDDEHFFVRTVLEVPIHESADPFTWGVWVSLSRDNFHGYRDLFDEPVQEGAYFGWFGNVLPWYPDTLNLKTMAHLRSGGQRPWLELEEADHPLCVDYRNGISWERAIEIAQRAMHGPRA